MRRAENGGRGKKNERKEEKKTNYEWLEVSNLELNLPHHDIMTIERIAWQEIQNHPIE